MTYFDKLRNDTRAAASQGKALVGELRWNPRTAIALAVGATAVAVGSQLVTHVESSFTQKIFASQGRPECVAISSLTLSNNEAGLDDAISRALSATPSAGRIVGFDVTVASAGGEEGDTAAQDTALATMVNLDARVDIDLSLSSTNVVTATSNLNAGSVQVNVITTTSCNTPNADYIA